MVASVSQRGYAATRVADVVEVSGVSTRSFYSLFEDKEALLLETIDAILAVATRRITASAAAEDDWASAATRVSAELLTAHPAAGRVCLVDSLGAGPRVSARLAEAVRRLEAPMADIAAGQSVALPTEVLTALVGGLVELARMRLLAGREAEIPKAFSDFAAIFSTYEPPAEPLRHTGRPPRPRPGPIHGHDHADRAVRAFTAVLADRGYAEASVEETIRRASMSARTFYANFAGKDDVLLAALESAATEAMAATTLAFGRPGEWAPGVRAALGALFNFLAFRPEIAGLLLVDYAGGGSEAIRRRTELLRPLGRLLDGGRRTTPTMPEGAGEAVSSAILALASRVADERGAAALPALAPICTHLALTPFIGTQAASEIAGGDGRGRGRRATLQRITREALAFRIHATIEDDFVSADVIAESLSVSREEVDRELLTLELLGHLETLEGEAGETLWRSRLRYMNTEEWGSLGQVERAAVSARILELLRAELTLATDGGTFDARTDRHLVHLRGSVDERGWADLTRIFDAATDAAMDVIAASEGRLAEDENRALDIRGSLILFEMPPPDE
ncbi:MAG TPA: helix-turn-helix domain-containing protein [Solirubrobacterales bacterium]|nr:helix-turn-helix domain-containing protein [Solirubrobacterales bacterium]